MNRRHAIIVIIGVLLVALLVRDRIDPGSPPDFASVQQRLMTYPDVTYFRISPNVSAIDMEYEIWFQTTDPHDVIIQHYRRLLPEFELLPRHRQFDPPGGDAYFIARVCPVQGVVLFIADDVDQNQRSVTIVHGESRCI